MVVKVQQKSKENEGLKRGYCVGMDLVWSLRSTTVISKNRVLRAWDRQLDKGECGEGEGWQKRE